MGRSYSLDLRRRVVSRVEGGRSCRGAAADLQVSPSFSVKLVARHRRTGMLEQQRQGRPPGTGKLAPHSDFLIGRVKQKPDITMPELGDFRWLTVGPAGQEDFSIVLMAIPGQPVMDEQTAGEVKNLMSKGFAGTVFLSTDDVRGDYEELKGRGVEFTDELQERPYGIDSGFRDPSGNALRLTQVNELVNTG